MKLKRKETGHIIPPCPKCPYRLHQIHTFVNPCPQCKENNYKSYDIFMRQVLGQCPRDEDRV